MALSEAASASDTPVRGTWLAGGWDLDQLAVVEQQLVASPFLPGHDQRVAAEPRLVRVRLVVEEKKITLAPSGEQARALTFDGSVPALRTGSFHIMQLGSRWSPQAGGRIRLTLSFRHGGAEPVWAGVAARCPLSTATGAHVHGH